MHLVISQFDIVFVSSSFIEIINRFEEITGVWIC